MRNIIAGLKKTILGKLIATILIIWLPVSIIFIAGFSLLSRHIINETIDNRTDKIRYYSAILNTDIEKMINSLNQLCGNYAVKDFASNWKGVVDEEMYSTYRQAYSILKEYRNLSLYIDDIFVYVDATGEILSANQSLINMTKEYEQMRTVCEEQGETFFHDGENLYYLQKSNTGMITGMKIYIQDIYYMLRGYDSEEEYRYFLVDAGTHQMLGNDRNFDDTDRSLYNSIDWSNEQPTELTVEREKYLVYRIGQQTNGFLIVLYMNKADAYSQIYIMYWAWILLTMLLLIVPTALSAMTWITIKRPIQKLSRAMEQVEKGNYEYLLKEDEAKEFNYVFRQYNQMTQKVRTLIQEVLEKQLQIEQARYKQLQMQINPHFLFNSLYMGYRMAQSEDCEAVGDLCMYLGDYFGILTFVSDESISIENEMKFVTTYLRLNQMRFGKKLSYEVEVEEGLEDDRIMPLLLQPLLENAISHGMEKCSHPCKIVVSVKRAGERVRFSVTDDADVITKEQITQLYQDINREQMPEKGFGLWNVQNRLKQHEKDHEGISMVKEGTFFTISFTIAQTQERDSQNV
ncbi:MAG: histidine kinase [Lachnospiraceae bacterium]|nr:histidine kinase [Lachnospiraceae bacterium]